MLSRGWLWSQSPEVLGVFGLALLLGGCGASSEGGMGGASGSGGASSGGTVAAGGSAGGAGGTTVGSGGSAAGTGGSRIVAPEGGSSGAAGARGTGGATVLGTGGSARDAALDAPSGGRADASATGGRSMTGGSTSTGGLASVGGTQGAGGAKASGGATGGGGTTPSPTGHYQMEDLDRGVVAVKVGGGVYVGWRMLGYEYDKANPGTVAYNVYRGTTKLATVTDSTNYLDASGTTSSTYAVSAVIGGSEGAQSAQATVWAQNYLRIPLTPPGGSYEANDGSPGDLDGDGQLEIVLKWQPSNAQDNSKPGVTDNTYLDGIKLDGTRLWRIDLGPNIRSGAHYTQHVVYDFDGDGKAEIAVKTAPGTKDGKGAYLRMGPAANDTDTQIYRDANGYVLSGPEYLTVFGGQTGEELATVSFEIGRGSVSAWGDDYGNRVDRFLSSAGFVSDQGSGKAASGRPSILMARGYYTRSTITAWNWRNGSLSKVWTSDSGSSTSTTGSAYGQGAHWMGMADADGDGAQEIIYGSAVISSDGKFRCSTGFGHGDALHIGDLIPSRKGIEVFMVHEAAPQPRSEVHDADTCAVVWKGPALRTAAQTGGDAEDNGRGVCDDVSAANPGAECWSALDTNLLSATNGSSLGAEPSAQNFLIYWDADESRELEDGTTITKVGGGTLLSASGCGSNNGTKATPTLTADLLGDWREELVLRESNNTGLRVYTTTDVTARRIYTLMHDPQYRMQVSSEQAAYNQPPHPGFHIGSGMADPPQPDIHVK
jgi:hypothetical protein